MRILAISGLLLLAAASAVSAAPAKDETGERVSYTDDKGKQAGPAGEWVELASPTPASHGREFLTVEGRYAQLRLDAAKGRPRVKAVRVIYKDGKERVQTVNRALDKKTSAVVDLSGAAIDHVVIVTDAKSRGSYTVVGVPVSGVASR